VQDAVDDVAEKERSVKTLTVKLQKHITELEAGRPELVAGAPKELMAMYQHALAAGRLPAMVPLTGTCCSACNLSLPLHMVYSVHHGMQVIRCDHCRRLLYSESWFEAPAVPAAATAPAKTAGAKAAVKG
jgi:predicted  nucleic acid-binding Zn-ribbon protein